MSKERLEKSERTPTVSRRPWAFAYSRDDRPYNFSCLSPVSKNRRFRSFFSALGISLVYSSKWRPAARAEGGEHSQTRGQDGVTAISGLTVSAVLVLSNDCLSWDKREDAFFLGQAKGRTEKERERKRKGKGRGRERKRRERRKGNWKWSFGRNGKNRKSPSRESNPEPQQTWLMLYHWATETSDITSQFVWNFIRSASA